MASIAQPHTPSPEEEQKQQQEEKKQEKRVARARLVQRLVENDGDLPDFMKDLIETQAVVVAGTEAAGFLVEGKTEDGKPELRTVAHVRPDNVEETIRRQALMAFRDIVTQCITEGKDGALRVGAGTEQVDPQFCLVTLLRSDDRVVAATAVITRCRDESRALQRLSTMQLVAGYFDMFLLKRQSEQNRQMAKTHQDVFQFASTVATAENFHASAAGLCNELATRTGAARVAVGWLHGEKIKLKAMSHTEEFDKKQELSVLLVKVMEECLDQDEFVQFDPAGQSTENVTREAMQLSQVEGGNRVVSIPLRRQSETVGILTLEFPPEKKSTPAESTGLAAAAELLAPQLYDRFQNDRLLITKTGLSIRDNTKKVVGLRTHTLAKVIVAGVIGLLLFLLFYSPMYTVSAPFSFVPQERSIVDVPYNGTIEKVFENADGRPYRAGDEVEAGTPIVKLETLDLENEMIIKRKEIMIAEARYRALVNNRRDPGAQSEAELSRLEADKLRSEAEVIQSKIDKATLVAPMGGVILDIPGKADLRERIGTEVQIGEPLIIVGDKDSLRLELAVADRDIQDVHTGQIGEFATAAQPGSKYQIEVVKVIPSAETKAGGGNTFTVIAEPVDPETRNELWLPSATGEARLDVEPRSLAWQWTHRAVDWVRLKLWI